MFKSINPYDQSIIGEYAPLSDNAINRKLEAAGEAFKQWRKESFSTRASNMSRVGELLRKNKEAYARTISLEMGKIITEARSEVEKCAVTCDYYVQNAERLLTDQPVATEAKKSFIHYQPLGVVLAVMPWNFPFWQVFRFAFPSLMAGNVGLLKHASNVCQTSLTIEQIFEEAGFPVGVFQSLLIGSDKIENLIQDDLISAVTLTGSEYAGTQVAAAAGRNIKKTVLELGGSDPFIVLEDADVVKAAEVATQSRMRNAGQSCIAGKRFIVVDKVKEEFVHHFNENIKKLKQGDPLKDETTMAPMAKLDLAKGLEVQLKKSIAAGARVISGGERTNCYFQPTLLDNVKQGMPAFDEETFGPMAAVISAKDESEAIAFANESRFGLGSSLWTKDLEKAEVLSKQIEAGSVFVNSLMRSDARLPFGGIKKSGYGRELSELGIKEFTNAKTIFIEQ